MSDKTIRQMFFKKSGKWLQQIIASKKESRSGKRGKEGCSVQKEVYCLRDALCKHRVPPQEYTRGI